MTNEGEPRNYEEKCQTIDVDKWELSIKEKIKLLIPDQTQKLAMLPTQKKVLHGFIG